MARPVNAQIKAEIISKTLSALAQEGLNNLSLRGIAQSIGVNARMLVYHFKSYDDLIRALFVELSLRHKKALRSVLETHSHAGIDEVFSAFAQEICLENNRNTMVLFCEFYVKAMRDPEGHASFIQETLLNWLTEIEDILHKRQVKNPKYFATLIVALYRGLLLDWLATHDNARIMKASKLISEIRR